QHCHFHKISFRTLNRHVGGRPFRTGANNKITAMNIWRRTATTKIGFNVALTARLRERRIDIPTDRRTERKILINKGLSLRKVHTGRSGEPVWAHTVENTKVDHLRIASLALSYRFNRYAVNIASGLSVNIDITIKVGNQLRVAC